MASLHCTFRVVHQTNDLINGVNVDGLLETAEGEERQQRVNQVTAPENDDGRHDGAIEEHTDELLQRGGREHGETYTFTRKVGLAINLGRRKYHGKGSRNGNDSDTASSFCRTAKQQAENPKDGGHAAEHDDITAKVADVHLAIVEQEVLEAIDIKYVIHNQYFWFLILR